jgi:hypothetical protein
MTKHPMDRARIAAFVDGELSPEEAAAVAMHLADHPADQAYADDLFASNAALATAFGAPLREPVPEAILATISGEMADKAPGARIVAFPRRPLVIGAGMALAASIGLAAVLFGPRDANPLATGPVPAGSGWAAILDQLPSGVVQAMGDGRDAMILATLPTPEGYCREVELVDRRAGETAVALACREGAAAWQIAVILKEPLAATGTEDGFVAADGAETEGLSVFLDERGAGLSLSPAEEAALIAEGWAK